MRRIGGAFERIIRVENLYGAWRDFLRGKRSRPSVMRFAVDAERRLLQLHRALAAGSYHPGPYRLHLVREPKVRLVAAAPVRDRVVHHALYRQLAPTFDRSLIDTSYACIPGRGTHRAVVRFLRALRSHRFALLLDVRHYFLCIHRPTLMAVLSRRLKEQRLLDLCGRIVESGRDIYQHPEVRAALGLEPGFPPDHTGIPIGNLTSQWWANHYLSGLDHFLKRQVRVAHVQRYMDDISLFADDPGALIDAREQAREWLWRERRLQLKDPNAAVRSTAAAFDHLGYRVRRQGLARTTKALARAELAAGNRDGMEKHLAEARRVADTVPDPDAKRALIADLGTIA